MEATILASAGRSPWRYLQARNIDADAFFTQSGLDPSLIKEPRTRYPVKRLANAYLTAATVTKNPSIGL